MSDDPAVQAAKDARMAHSPSQDSSWNRHWCSCGEQFTSLARYEDHRNAAAVEAARPIIEAEIADRVRAAYQRFLDTDDLDVLRDCLSELPWGAADISEPEQ